MDGLLTAFNTRKVHNCYSQSVCVSGCRCYHFCNVGTVRHLLFIIYPCNSTSKGRPIQKCVCRCALSPTTQYNRFTNTVHGSVIGSRAGDQVRSLTNWAFKFETFISTPVACRANPKWQSFNLLSRFRWCAIVSNIRKILSCNAAVIQWVALCFVVHCVCAFYTRACVHVCVRACKRVWGHGCGCGHVYICVTSRIVRTASCTNCSSSRWSSDVYYQLYKSRPRYIL